MLKTNLLYGPAVSFLDLLPKAKTSTSFSTGSFSVTLLIIVVTVPRKWKQSKHLSTEWELKMWHIDTMEHYPAVRKKWNHEVCKEMGGARMYHTECDNPDSERQIMPICTYWRFFSDVRSTQLGLTSETRKVKWIPKRRTIETGIAGYKWFEEGSKKARGTLN